MRHCDGQQWSWWDGAANQGRDYADWQRIGQDDDADSTCTSNLSGDHLVRSCKRPFRGKHGHHLRDRASRGDLPKVRQHSGPLPTSVGHRRSPRPSPMMRRPVSVPVCTPVRGRDLLRISPGGTGHSGRAGVVSPVTRFQLAPFSATWAPSEGATGYDVQWRSASFHGGFPATWHEATTTDTSLALPFHAGDTVCFLITAFNDGGSSPGSEGCTAAPVDDRALRVSGGSWTRTKAPRHYRGTATTSKAQGSTLVLEGIETRAICLIVEDHPDGGVVDLLWNGRLLRRISTDGPAGRRCVGIRPWVRAPRRHRHESACIHQANRWSSTDSGFRASDALVDSP